MNSAKNWPSKYESLLLALALCGYGCAGLLAGCAPTITPRVVQSQSASFDGNAQNSGLVGFDDAGNGILTEHGWNRYLELVHEYGSHFTPPLAAPELSAKTATNTFLIDRQHLAYFAAMNRWKKQGANPHGP